jgi:RNA polymerase sigma-70 factor (ECF subfamily)
MGSAEAMFARARPMTLRARAFPWLPSCPTPALCIQPRAMGMGGDELEALLAKVADGDRRAFRALYDAVGGRLYAAALRILGDASLAEDAVQDAFLRVWRSAATFDPARGVVLAWMGRIVRNAAFDRLPREGERDLARVEEIDIAVMPVEPADARLRHCLQQLPEVHGRAIVLMYVHGMTHPELSARLQAPLGTVKSWIRRGCEALRKCVGGGA